MPEGKHVHSDKWTHVIELYDDGEYSAIWGKFISPFSRCLGVRWNDRFGAAGHPNHGPHPLWYAESPWLAKTILLELCDRVNKNPKLGSLENILTALGEMGNEKWQHGIHIYNSPHPVPLHPF